MKNYLKHDPWKIIEDGFHPEYNKISESIFSIGNGRMGQRANFEEGYGGETLQGSYVAGVYYPDKTRVGWWKNGYPEYFAKVLNAANWIGIDVFVGDRKLDLSESKVESFYRELDMKKGLLSRRVTLSIGENQQLEINSTRFCSMERPEIGVIDYRIRLKNFSDALRIKPYVDFDVINQDSNYGEKFWDEVNKEVNSNRGWVTAKTKKTDFHVCTGMDYQVFIDEEKVDTTAGEAEKEKYISSEVEIEVEEGSEVRVLKYCTNISSEYHGKDNLNVVCLEKLDEAVTAGYDQLLDEQVKSWSAKWEESDIVIEGDVAAQQGIRFNIFQMNQTYTGEDERLNIGPKGFTGEKYGGSTYWDTEAYCLPFYLSTAEQKVARNLLMYRYKHLEKAIENAEKLGFKDGAALYPMVTMNGEECHNEWEITFEEIHRNGAIAYAIYDYTRYTGDVEYLYDYGIEVLIGISRFWAQRVNYSNAKNQYVMLGVTGPNEYENNVNNNWYTNYIARWTLRYTLEAIENLKSMDLAKMNDVVTKTNLQDTELTFWKEVVENIYLPYDEDKQVFLQQDGFLDKDIKTVSELAPEDRPINQKWSWDRILRSCFIKQADVLQGIYFFEDEFSTEEIRRNFEYYEPMTVHESSLSPCVHVILASRLGMEEKAYEMYLRTARLDLDDYNNDTEDGCHITSMAGTWMSFVKGFGGMKMEDGKVSLSPYLPENWKSYNFSIRFRGAILHVGVSKDGVEINNLSDHTVKLLLYNNEVIVDGNKSFSQTVLN